MDRLSWYQQGESMEEILIQAGHVGIYDGDLKQSTFDQGTASLTLQRVIWADALNPDTRLILHHSLVERIDRHHKTMFGRGGKIIVTLKPISSAHVQQGPVAASGSNSLRFVFRNGGEEDFYKRYADALNRKTWARTSSSSSSGGSSRNSNVHSGSISGQSGQRAVVMERRTEHPNKIQESISQAFEDLSSLMNSANGLVNATKILTERLRLGNGEDELIQDEETIKFKTHLLNLGICDAVTKTVFGDEMIYFDKLAEEICGLLLEPLKACGGTLSLIEAFCYINRLNRLQNTPLISPDDLINACKRFDDLDLPISLTSYKSGVVALQLRSKDNQAIADETSECVGKMGTANPSLLSKELGISAVMAMEHLLIAEAQAKVCRDETDEGLTFYPNKFSKDADQSDIGQTS
ncbi:Vacuolar protein-sorting-associated protein 36 [Aphelenchoides bicaudatus]|nr:Vacuolar protein-sorting-associated protein 36 [Aphelenchoides bicaudatus]